MWSCMGAGEWPDIWSDDVQFHDIFKLELKKKLKKNF